MKIRVMGTKDECEQAQDYYREFGKSDIVAYCSVSDLYANRGSTNVYRVYIDISYKVDSVVDVKSLARIKTR